MLKHIFILVTIAWAARAWSSSYDGDNPFERAHVIKTRVLNDKEFKPYYTFVTHVQKQLSTAKDLEFTMDIPSECVVAKPGLHCLHRDCLLVLMKLKDAGYGLRVHGVRLSVHNQQHKMICGPELFHVSVYSHDYSNDLHWKDEEEKTGEAKEINQTNI